MLSNGIEVLSGCINCSAIAFGCSATQVLTQQQKNLLISKSAVQKQLLLTQHQQQPFSLRRSMLSNNKIRPFSLNKILAAIVRSNLTKYMIYSLFVGNGIEYKRLYFRAAAAGRLKNAASRS
jgi:hypothetical protein